MISWAVFAPPVLAKQAAKAAQQPVGLSPSQVAREQLRAERAAQEEVEADGNE